MAESVFLQRSVWNMPDAGQEQKGTMQPRQLMVQGTGKTGGDVLPTIF